MEGSFKVSKMVTSVCNSLQQIKFSFVFLSHQFPTSYRPTVNKLPVWFRFRRICSHSLAIGSDHVLLYMETGSIMNSSDWLCFRYLFCFVHAFRMMILKRKLVLKDKNCERKVNRICIFPFYIRLVSIVFHPLWERYRNENHTNFEVWCPCTM